jgi:hypothetical protein
MEEFVARNFAEALARLFMKKLRLMIEHGDPVMMRVDGEFRQADPSSWTDDVGISIRVGLGSGKKEARLAARLQVAQLQSEAYAAGTGLVDAKKLYNSGAGIVRDAGLGDPNDFWIDPDSAGGQPQGEKPDPETAKAQADAQMQAAKLQGEQALAGQKMQMMREESSLKLQLAREQAEAEAQLARDKADFEADLARERMAQEGELARQRMELEASMAAHKADLAERSAMSKNRPGGDLSK